MALSIASAATCASLKALDDLQVVLSQIVLKSDLVVSFAREDLPVRRVHGDAGQFGSVLGNPLAVDAVERQQERERVGRLARSGRFRADDLHRAARQAAAQFLRLPLAHDAQAKFVPRLSARRSIFRNSRRR